MPNEVVLVFDPRTIRQAVAMAPRSGKKLRKQPRLEVPNAPRLKLAKLFVVMHRDLSEEIRSILLPQLDAIIADSPQELRIDVRQDIGETLTRVIGRIRTSFASRFRGEERVKSAANETARIERERSRSVFREVLNVVPQVSTPWLEPILDRFSRENAELVHDVASQFVSELERSVSNGVRQGLRAPEIAKRVVRDFVGVKKGSAGRKLRNRGRLIARDQIGSLYGDIERARQIQLGVQRYRWRTSRDERVRGLGKPRTWPGSHTAREGEIFSWTGDWNAQLATKGLVPAAIDGHPGRPIGCRCTAEPVLEDLV